MNSREVSPEKAFARLYRAYTMGRYVYVNDIPYIVTNVQTTNSPHQAEFFLTGNTSVVLNNSTVGVPKGSTDPLSENEIKLKPLYSIRLGESMRPADLHLVTSSPP